MRSDHLRRVVANFGWLSVAEVLIRLAGIVVAVWLARTFGPSLYGALGVALALVNVLEMVVRAGTGPYGVRETARNPGAIADLHSSICSIRLPLAALVIGIVVLAAPTLEQRLSVPAPLIRVSSLMVLVPALTVAWALRGLERMDVLATTTVAQRLAVLTGVLLLVHGAGDVLWVPAIETAAGLAAVAWYRVFLIRNHSPLPLGAHLWAWRTLLPETLPVTASALLALVYLHGGVLMLGSLSGAGDAGLYLAAQKIVLTFAVLSALLNKSAFPAVSRLMATAPDRALVLQGILYRYLMLPVAPVVVIFALFGGDILAALFGAKFAAAAPVMAVLALSLPLVALSEVLKHLLLARNHAGRMMIGVGTSAAVHVVLALVLIPRWGLAGAAAACLLGELAGSCVLMAVTARSCGGVPLERRSAAPFVAGMAMAATIYVTGQGAQAWGILAGGAVYVVVVRLMGALSLKEWGGIRRTLTAVVSPERETAPAGQDSRHVAAGEHHER